MSQTDTVVHLTVLEFAPLVLVSTESSVHNHVAVLSIAACYSLFASGRDAPAVHDLLALFRRRLRGRHAGHGRGQVKTRRHVPLCSDDSRYSERAPVATPGPLPRGRADRRMFAVRLVSGWLCLHAAPDGAVGVVQAVSVPVKKNTLSCIGPYAPWRWAMCFYFQ